MKFAKKRSSHAASSPSREPRIVYIHFRYRFVRQRPHRHRTAQAHLARDALPFHCSGKPSSPQSVPADCQVLWKDPNIYVFSVRIALCFNIYQRGALPLPLIAINCAHESARMFSGVTSFIRMDHFLSQCWTVRRTWKRNESAASSLVTSHSTLRWCRASNRTAT